MSVQGNDFPPAEPEAVPSFSRYFCLLRKLPMPGSGTGPSDDQFHPKIFASSPVDWRERMNIMIGQTKRIMT